jgi:thymidine kinase
MSLRVYVGPMFSSKTTRLIQEITKYSDIYNDRPIIINHTFDDRDSGHVISSHSSLYRGLGDKIDVIATDKLSKVNVADHLVIGIDEISFFTDLYEIVSHWIQEGKHIICAGLDGDIHMDHFGQVHDLLPIADEFVKLTAVCTLCLKEKMANLVMMPFDITSAPFTAKIGGDAEKVFESGGADKYIAVCRKHHANKDCQQINPSIGIVEKLKEENGILERRLTEAHKEIGMLRYERERQKEWAEHFTEQTLRNEYL